MSKVSLCSPFNLIVVVFLHCFFCFCLFVAPPSFQFFQPPTLNFFYLISNSFPNTIPLMHFFFSSVYRTTSAKTFWCLTSRSCTKPLWNANMTYHTVYDALLLQCNTSELPTCHTLITSTNGTVTALPPTSVSMTTATKTALTRSEACFCHPETFCFLSCSPGDTFGSPLCQMIGSMISRPLIRFDSVRSLLAANIMAVSHIWMADCWKPHAHPEERGSNHNLFDIATIFSKMRPSERLHLLSI